jgi:SAM-dependent methyltransferase
VHEGAYSFVRSVAGQRPSGLVVEIGGRNVNGTIRDLFKDERYISTDKYDGPGVDIVADGTTYVPPEPAACVVCCEVLEHTPDAETICRHAHDILATGGVFIVTTAMHPREPHSAIDGSTLRAGEYYGNVDERRLLRWLVMFDRVTIEQHADRGDIYAIAHKGPA